MFVNRAVILFLFGMLGWPQTATDLVSVGVSSLVPTLEVVLTGYVTDKDSGSPIQGAQVSVKGQTHGAITDRTGAYTLNLPEDWVGRRITVVVQRLSTSRMAHSSA